MLSERFAARNLTGPLVFLVAGLAPRRTRAGASSSVDIESSTVHALAEITLALLLFADASMVPLAAARQDLPLTARLLGDRAAAVDRRRHRAGRAPVPEPAARPGRPDRGQPGADRRRPERVGDRRRAAPARGPAGAERRERAERRHRHARRHVLHRRGRDGARRGRHELRGRVRRALAELAIGVGVGAGVALRRRSAHRASPTGAAGCSTARGAWPRWPLALLAFLVASEVGGNPFVAAFIGGLVFGATAADRRRRVGRAHRARRQPALARAVVHLRRRLRAPGVRGPRPAATRALRGRQPHRRAHGAGRHRAARLRPGPGDDGVRRLVRPARAGVGGVRPARRRGARRWRPPRRRRPCTPSPSRSCSASSPTGSRPDRWPPATSPRWPSAIAGPRWADRPMRVTTAGRVDRQAGHRRVPLRRRRDERRSPDRNGPPRRRNEMSPDRHARTMLPIPDRPAPGLTTYDAKDPDTSFPPIEPLLPPAGAPNVLVVLLDDVGFGASSAFGGSVQHADGRTPGRRWVALQPVPHHGAVRADPGGAAVGPQPPFGRDGVSITETATSAPGNSSLRPNTKAPLAMTLKLNGYSTAQFGKCHEVPVWQSSPMGPFDAWPSRGGGFEYFYGFIGGENNQWDPALYNGTTPVEPPATPEEGYHLTEDLADHAIGWVRQQKALMPDKPFFVYFAPGATHAPHHVPKEWADRYAGPVRRRLGRAARAHVRPPEGAGRHPGRRRADRAPRRDPGVGRHARRAQAGAGPRDGGVRRVPRAHRPSRRPADRRHRGPRDPRRHDRSTTSSATTARPPRARSTGRSTRWPTSTGWPPWRRPSS